MDLRSRICVAGSSGLLGHALINQLREAGYDNIILCDLPEVDLCDQKTTDAFFEKTRPEYVFFLAALFGGIEYKMKHPADILIKNVQMITNTIEAFHKYQCTKMINICSALLYPSTAQLPLKEEDITLAELDMIDTPYSLAKVVGMQLARSFNRQYGTKIVTAVPCNFFGENAPFEGNKAGVVPSLIAKFHNAKINSSEEVEVWGTGNACRELLNSKDVAKACIYIMNKDTDDDLINIGRGCEYSIREVAETVKDIVGYEGKLVFASDKPEGRMHMQLNVDKLFNMGWLPSMDLRESIKDTYDWYLNNIIRGD